MNNTKAIIKSKVKSHIPKDWINELRITYRIFMETWYGIKRAGWLNLVIISTMAAILLIFGALFRTTLSLSTFSGALGNVLEISVYLKNGTDTAMAQKKLLNIEHVEKVTLKTKEASWAEMQKEMDVAGMSNPLPDTVRLKVDKPENITPVFAEAKGLDFVEDLNYSKDIAQRLQFINKIVHIVTFLIIVVVAVLTVAIINNTIHLVIQSRKDEIEIMRLMGVSNWFIKLPLVMQGAAYGFAGAVISMLPMKAVETGLDNVHNFFAVPRPMLAVNIVTFVMFVFAIGCSASGSLMSIKKHLQV